MSDISEQTDPGSTPALPPKPKRPEDYECCGRHCEPCIFDYYDRAVARWEKKVAAIKEQDSSS